MNKEELKKIWLDEEKNASITGWDFSYIDGRYEEEDDFPWNYENEIKKRLTDDKKLLDIDTGGGEFLLSLKHPYGMTAATEGYPPNTDLCRRRLTPLGIDFVELTDYKNTGFADNSFDIVIDRHGDYDESELYRIIKPGGFFITQQVGEQNDRDIAEFLLPGTPVPFPGHNLKNCVDRLSKAGFKITKQNEYFGPIRFYDTSALVWFCKIIEWEFPGFSVEKCFDKLLEVQKTIEYKGGFDGTVHRFFIIGNKE